MQTWLAGAAALMAAVAGSAGVSPAAAADRLQLFATHQAWRINAAFDAGNRLTRCIASGRYKSGIYFAIAYHAKKQFWYLQFFDPSWPTRSGRTTATLSVDDKVVSRPTMAWINRSAFLSLGRSVDSVVGLMKGRRLTIDTPAGRSAFRLDGSFGATLKVVECIKRYQGTTTASPGGAFGPGGGSTPPANSGQGAFGGAPGTSAGASWKLPRADTLQYAVTYLDKRGRTYKILPEGKQIFKHLPVNWIYTSSAFGGMVAFKRGHMSGSSALNLIIGSHTKICDVKSAIVHDKPVSSGSTTTLKAKGACESSKGSYIAEFSVVEQGGKAVFMIVEMLDKTPRRPGLPAAPPARKRLPPGVQEG